MLTARGTETDRVIGLELGAYDYVVKPFSSRELFSWIRAILRRSGTGAPEADAPRIEILALAIDVPSRRVSLDGEPVNLSRKEFDLLALLMSKPDATFTREQIMSSVWDENYWGSTRTLDTHVSTLRRKIGDDSDPPTLIVTVRGVGFRFEG